MTDDLSQLTLWDLQDMLLSAIDCWDGAASLDGVPSEELDVCEALLAKVLLVVRMEQGRR